MRGRPRRDRDQAVAPFPDPRNDRAAPL